MTKQSSQAGKARNQRKTRGAPQQAVPQQLQPSVAGPSNSQLHSNVVSAPRGPFNQASQANAFSIGNLNYDGSVVTHPANEPVNHNAAANQLVGNSNKPTPEDVSKMQYNLLFGPVLDQPELPGPSQTTQQQFHYQPTEVGPTPQAEGEDDSDLFGDIDFEQELANSLQPLVEFNERN